MDIMTWLVGMLFIYGYFGHIYGSSLLYLWCMDFFFLTFYDEKGGEYIPSMVS